MHGEPALRGRPRSAKEISPADIAGEGGDRAVDDADGCPSAHRQASAQWRCCRLILARVVEERHRKGRRVFFIAGRKRLERRRFEDRRLGNIGQCLGCRWILHDRFVDTAVSQYRERNDRAPGRASGYCRYVPVSFHACDETANPLREVDTVRSEDNRLRRAGILALARDNRLSSRRSRLCELTVDSGLCRDQHPRSRETRNPGVHDQSRKVILN